ncbi:MAG TPA: hypothetical protein VFR48_02485, partial [Solirubrobacteraceae bacterium]|nr:hypothetical protein [Solirubrobacteraceae bacterium]
MASLLASAAMVLFQLVSPAGASATAGSSLGANPLLVPSGDLLFFGQQAAAEAARRSSPQAVFARQRSRLAYVHLGRAGVGPLLERSFPAVMDHPSDGLAAVPHGAHVTGYASTHALELSLPGGRPGIIESSLPLATHSAHGRLSPIDLTLRPSGGGYAPVNSSLAVSIPSQIANGVGIPADGVTVTPVGADGRAARAQGALVGSAVVYAGSQPGVDTIVKPTVGGFQIDATLRSVDSPQKLYFKVGAPAGLKLVEESHTGVVNIVRAGRVLATIQPPGAVDAAGTAVPTSMEVSGHLLVVSVAHRSGSYLYPIDVDPEVNDSQLATTSGGKRSNWVFKTTSEARFGHAAVYEGSGKERLETTGIAEYVGTEYAYWGYETKGNSKIYELKTKTSAKNKGAKIESFLQFSTAATNENAKTLSTEASESEYSEKVSTICAWNASKVEECLPTAGKEKNGIRLQQSATASPGAGFKFSDTMSEGIVSISEPSGQHSTTSFNTTSPEIEGEVIIEGKKVTQKRENALYGAGIWITNAKGALKPIAKDPGIGVSATRLEYEKSSGVWETLSEHNYLNENGCVGVQCYVEHSEFWTLDPKLPNGEDKIRYRAEEAIAGTVSLTTETESTKVIKVDTGKPYNIRLQGLPSGEELTERPYALTAEATDGEEKVPSSGIEGVRTGSKGEVTGRGIRLLVDGKEVTETGTQAGCTVVKGPCTSSATWSINGGELPAGHHAIEVVATDNAGNETEAYYTFTVRHSTPVALGPGSVDLQSGDFSMSATDVDMGSGLTVGRDVSSRSPQSVLEGPLGRQWGLNLGTTEHLEELANKSVLLTDERGEQTIFASIGGGEFEAPYGDSNLKLRLEENAGKTEKLAYYLEDVSRHAKTKFTLPNVSTTMWVPTIQEGTVPSDTVTYKYQASEALAEYAAASGSAPTMIAAGTDGAVWFVNANGGIGRATSAGAVTEYSVPLAPTAIAVSAKGEIWFTTFNDKIGRMTSGGVLTQYSVKFWGLGITVGPENNMWFTNYNAA